MNAHTLACRLPALDGIRGIAVLAVLGHNLGWNWLKGGFFGVDIFFALSGFLITTLLLEEYSQSGTISLAGFFRRRALRLWPVLVALVAFSLLSVVLFNPAVTPERLALVAVSVLGYFSNYVLTTDSQSWTGGMSHTWSLAVEAHFYIFWAVTVFAVTRRRGLDLKYLAITAVCIAAGSAVWRIFVWNISSDFNWPYCVTDTRLDAVFLGVLASIFRLRQLAFQIGRRIIHGTEIACIALLIALFYGVRQSSAIPYWGGFTLAGAIAALLILTTLLSEHSLVAGVVKSPWLVWFGKISYSIYIWHVPMSKLVRADRLIALGVPSPAAEMVRAAASIVVAAGSYYLIEKRFIKPRITRIQER